MTIITRLLSLVTVVLCAFGLWCPSAYAQGAVQASIAGVVRDTSGAVLSGFNIVKREAIELTGSLTATIDVEMRVGSLEETLTVTGESPIVDVQSIKQQRVIDDEAIHSI